MSTFADRAIAHLRENAPATSDLGRFFRATGHVRSLGVDQDPDPAPALDKLAAIRELRDRLAEEADQGALAARKLGATWEQIGAALDLTRQAAQQRWGNVARFAGWDD